MKKINVRKLTLTRETLRRLDVTTLRQVPGGRPVAGTTNTEAPAPGTIVVLPNTKIGTSCELCSDYIYCGPTAPADPNQ